MENIKNRIKQYFKKEETAKEVEERLMRIIRKLYTQLEDLKKENVLKNETETDLVIY